ncbi:MAG: bactofilin family protein [Ferruginibacter sp.]
MFNPKTRSTEPSTGSTTIIGAGTTITGNIQSLGDIRIDGTLVGNLSSTAKVLVGNEGVIQGNLKAEQADILGKVTGEVRVKDLLQLKEKCIVQGDIYTGKLQVEPSATFNGNCHMGANVVEISAERPLAVNQ